MDKVFIMCGLPGSGKSTWARNYVIKNSCTIIICKDVLREMINGAYIFKPLNELIVDEMFLAIIKVLNDLQNDVIIDDSIDSLTRSSRKRLAGLFPGREVYFVACSTSGSLLENRMTEPRKLSRERWRKVIEELKDQYEVPSEELEGFQVITYCI